MSARPRATGGVPRRAEEFEADPEELFDMAHGTGGGEDHHPVLRLDLGLAVRAHELAVAIDRADPQIVRKVQIAQRRADQG